MMVEIYLLEQIDAFARTGTLSAAAEELHITQPALSRSMRKIEDELGVPLFDRKKTRIRLNETGHLVATLAARILDEDRDLQRRAVALDRQLRTVSVGSCGPWPLMQLARPLQRCFPDRTISTEVVEDNEELLRGLRARTYQLVVVRQVPDGRDIHAQCMGQENMTVALKRTHPLAKRASITFDDLAGESVLALGNDSFWTDLVRRRCPKTNILFQTDLVALEDLVTRTDLPTFSSDAMASSGYTEDDRVDVPIDDPEAHATFYLCCVAAERKRYEALLTSREAHA